MGAAPHLAINLWLPRKTSGIRVAAFGSPRVDADSVSGLAINNKGNEAVRGTQRSEGRTYGAAENAVVSLRRQAGSRVAPE